MHTLHGKDLWRIGPAVVGVLILVGVATGLGITKAVGCVSELPWVVAPGSFGSAPPWSSAPLNVGLSAVFVAFACTAAVSTRRIALGLMTVEFVGFVAFLLLLRGGYAVGIAGAPITQVVLYDALTVAGQAGCLGLLAFGREADERMRVRVVGIGVGAALLIVTAKAAFFPFPAW
jgi:hypothetical protein